MGKILGNTSNISVFENRTRIIEQLRNRARMVILKTTTGNPEIKDVDYNVDLEFKLDIESFDIDIEDFVNNNKSHLGGNHFYKVKEIIEKKGINKEKTKIKHNYKNDFPSLNSHSEIIQDLDYQGRRYYDKAIYQGEEDFFNIVQEIKREYEEDVFFDNVLGDVKKEIMKNSVSVLVKNYNLQKEIDKAVANFIGVIQEYNKGNELKLKKIKNNVETYKEKINKLERKIEDKQEEAYEKDELKRLKIELLDEIRKLHLYQSILRTVNVNVTGVSEGNKAYTFLLTVFHGHAKDESKIGCEIETVILENLKHIMLQHEKIELNYKEIIASLRKVLERFIELAYRRIEYTVGENYKRKGYFKNNPFINDPKYDFLKKNR